MDANTILYITLIVLALVFLITYMFHVNSQKSPSSNTPNDTGKTQIVLPLKLKAYERLIIFLERIKPGSMVMRLNNSSLSSGQLQLECLKNIREEFEHNLSMQMYISESSWMQVKAAKEETLDLIKSAGNKVAPNGTSLDLAKAMLELETESNNTRIDLAINLLKAEIKSQF